MYILPALKTALTEASGSQINEDSDANAISQFITKKLFNNISNKSDHELIREVMKSQGNIEKIEGYSDFIESIKVLQLRAMEQNASNTKQVLDLLLSVRDTIQSNSKEFQKAFRKGDMESKTIQLTYASVVSALFLSNSILIAHVVDYANDPMTIKKIIINDGRAKDIAQSLPIERLRKFINTSQNVKFKKFLSEAAHFENECLNEFTGVIFAIAGTVAVGVALLSFIRDIVDFIFSARQKAAGWLKIQGNLLKMNSLRQEAGSNVRKKQEEYSEQFYTLASKIQVESSYAEKSATKEINSSNNDINSGVEKIKSDDQFSQGSSGLI